MADGLATGGVRGFCSVPIFARLHGFLTPNVDCRKTQRISLFGHGLRLGVGRAVPSRIIRERAFEFAARVSQLANRVRHRGPTAAHIAMQLLKCSMSVGASCAEAQGAQTKADFIAKLAIARKEAHEARYWLRIAVEAAVVKRPEIAWEARQSEELIAMLTAAVKTAQSSPSRTRRDPDH